MAAHLDLFLDEALLEDEPFSLFRRWLGDAERAELPEFNAMTLATCGASGVPTARMVLLRGHDERGFAFFTNYDSRKGADLAQNPRAALTFFWAPLHRQIRVEGSIEKTSVAESDAYFASRPRGHRLGAWVSPQSTLIPSREYLDHRLETLRIQYPDETPIPRPEHWGGYRVAPTMIEYWQGRENRLHDRIRYSRTATGWKRERLAP